MGRGWALDYVPFAYQEALTLSTDKWHSQHNDGSSRQVFPIDLPTNTAGIFYRLDIRDEGDHLFRGIALALGAAYLNLAANLASMLSIGTRSLGQGATASPLASTECYWHIVPGLAAAQEFIQIKGTTLGKLCYRQDANICAETRDFTGANYATYSHLRQ